MILYKKPDLEKIKKRPIEIKKIMIEEDFERPEYVIKSNNDRKKFVLLCEAYIRKSIEYKDYMKFLKANMDWRKCEVMTGLKCGNGKKYTIEIHHEPFTLFQITETILNKFDIEGKKYNPFAIAEEVMELHYDGKIGLIPLSKTIHELVTNDKLFIPMNYILGIDEVFGFYNDYEEFISPITKENIELKLDMSMKCGELQSDVLKAEFTYLQIDGMNLPEIPESWGKLLKENDAKSLLNALAEKTA